jgi:hypothetical protein
MSGLREIMHAFVEGDLDYAGLQRKLSEEVPGSESPESAAAILELFCQSEKTSPAVRNLLRRAVDRCFLSENTAEIPDIRPTRAREAVLDAQPADDTEENLPPIFAQDQDEPDVTLEQAEPRDPLTEPQPGDVIAGRYELEGLVGRGGMGLVYRALDRCRQAAGVEETRVAIKILKPELAARSEAWGRLFREGLRGMELRHENLVHVYDVGAEGELCFVTMELLEGDTLRAAIVRRSPEGFPTDEGTRILGGITKGLACLHSHGLVHGDLKPGNIFLDSQGKPKLTDFGTTVQRHRNREPVLEGGGASARTPAYASAELLEGRPPDYRDDVFALGCLAAEMFSSRHPFGRVQADQARERKLRPAMPSRLPAALRRAIAASLSFDRKRRPANADAFLREASLVRQKRRPLFAVGMLTGLAIGVLSALAIIHPGGPVGSLLGPPPAPVADSGADPAMAAARLQTSDDEPAIARPSEEDEADVAIAGPQVVGKPVAVSPDSGALGEDSGTQAPGIDAGGRFSAAAVDDPPEQPATEEPETVEETQPPEPPPAPPGPGSVAFSAAEYRVAEGNAVVIATIVRRDGQQGPVSVHWRTVSDTAAADEDFISSDWDVVRFADGQTSAKIYVPLVADGIGESQERFYLELGRPDGGARLGSLTRTRVMIDDDD